MKIYRVKVNGKLYEVELEEVENHPKKHISTKQKDTAGPSPHSRDGEDIKAPMQGTIQKIIAKENQTVKKGDTLCILEAMKMENEVTSDKDGTIAAVLIDEEDTVDAGDVLFKVN